MIKQYLCAVMVRAIGHLDLSLRHDDDMVAMAWDDLLWELGLHWHHDERPSLVPEGTVWS